MQDKEREEKEKFIKGHFRYSINSNWNHSYGPAEKIKLYSIKDLFSSNEFYNKSYDYLEDEGAYLEFNDILKEFNKNNSKYEIHVNGRSGGYLVLSRKGNNYSLEFQAEKPSLEDLNQELNECLEEWNIDGYKDNLLEYNELMEEYENELNKFYNLLIEFDKTCLNACKAFISFVEGCEGSRLEDKEVVGCLDGVKEINNKGKD